MKLLLFAWFLFVASAFFWLLAYKGVIDVGWVGAAAVVIACASVAFLAGLGARDRARTKRSALLSTVPTVALLAAAALAGYLSDRQAAEFRGEPLFLHFITLWPSWGESARAGDRACVADSLERHSWNRRRVPRRSTRFFAFEARFD